MERERAHAEAARVAVALREATEQARADRDARDLAVRERLEADAQAASRRLESARAQHQQTLARRQQLGQTLERLMETGEGMQDGEQVALQAEIEVHDSRLTMTGEALACADRDRSQVEELKAAQEARRAHAHATEEAIRLRLYAELDGWLNEAQEEEQQAQTAPSSIDSARNEDLDQPLPQGLLDDVHSLLAGGADPGDLRHRVVEDRSILTRRALAAAASEKPPSDAEIQGARTHSPQLRQNERPLGTDKQD